MIEIQLGFENVRKELCRGEKTTTLKTLPSEAKRAERQQIPSKNGKKKEREAIGGAPEGLLSLTSPHPEKEKTPNRRTEVRPLKKSLLEGPLGHTPGTKKDKPKMPAGGGHQNLKG